MLIVKRISYMASSITFVLLLIFFVDYVKDKLSVGSYYFFKIISIAINNNENSVNTVYYSIN